MCLLHMEKLRLRELVCLLNAKRLGVGGIDLGTLEIHFWGRDAAYLMEFFLMIFIFVMVYNPTFPSLFSS